MDKSLLTLDHSLPLSASPKGAERSFLDARSPSMKAVEAVIRELAHSSVPVLLIGERGTGKRTLAERIHRNCNPSPREFRVLKSSDLIPTTLGTGLLGDASTAYFEEICGLSLECQKQLLNFLSSQGTNGASGGRVICGSSRDLERDVREGNFREDLYYRLSGVCLRIPPLRQRKEDISPLLDFFLLRYSEAFHHPLPALSPSTQQLFFDYSWPGNLYELEAAARAIVALGDESVALDGLRSILKRSNGGLPPGKISLKEASRAACREAEKELILKVLTRTRWNRRRAAEELQISYKALLYKLKQIGYGEYETGNS
jgi:two-component system response regulator AtoC